MIFKSAEFILICITAVVCFLVVEWWPESVSLGRFILILSLLFLFQTLLRDFWLISRLDIKKQSRIEGGRMVMCVESILGILAVVCGCVLLFSSINISVQLSALGWSVSIFLTMLLCFFLKDYVMEFRPFRIYNDLDHLNIVVGWN